MEPAIRKRVTPILACDLAVAVVLFGLIAWAATWRPLHHDEASTWYFVNDGLGPLWDSLRGDVHPPLWFWFAWLVLDVADAGFYTLRLTSGLFTVAGFVIFMASMRQLLNMDNGASDRNEQSREYNLSLIGLSPFLLFIGYQARYYGLVVLLVAILIWALVKLWELQNIRSAVFVGIIYSLLAATNYVAAAALGPVALGVLIYVSRKKSTWRLLLACAIPGLICAFCILPLLLEQISNEGSARLSLHPIVLVKGMLLHGAYSVYCILLGDGTPPWSVTSWVLLPVICYSLFCFLWRWKKAAGVEYLVPIICAGTLGLSFLLSAATMGSGKLLEAPVRMPFIYLILAAALIVLAYNGTRVTWRCYLLLVLTNSVAIFMFSCENRENAIADTSAAINTTNWAYRIPSESIANQIEEWSEDQPTIVFLPKASFRNIQYTLEHSAASEYLSIYDTSKKNDRFISSDKLIIITERRGAGASHAEAIDQIKTFGYSINPKGNPSEWLLVPEPPIALALKKRLFKREIYESKLQIRQYSLIGPARKGD